MGATTPSAIFTRVRTAVHTGVTSANDYPQYLRYVVSYDEENDKRLGFFTNNFELPALTIA
ncbi:MAG: hypothetical protein M3N38_10040, partial [Pseudomonadota bacterium]|nr:hypothetical protein [Pseudomonadota bacterium]